MYKILRTKNFVSLPFALLTSANYETKNLYSFY